MKIFIIVLVLALSACKSTDGGVALDVEKSVRTTVVSASTIVEPLVCGRSARTLMGNAPCLKFLDVLEPTVNMAIEYNLALQHGTLPKVAEMVAAITKLIDAIKSLVPASAQRDQAITELTTASVLAAKGR